MAYDMSGIGQEDDSSPETPPMNDVDESYESSELLTAVDREEDSSPALGSRRPSHQPASNERASPPSPTSPERIQKKKRVQDIAYAVASYGAIYLPVSIAMILSALAVNWITTEAWSEATRDSLEQQYTVRQSDDDASNATLLGDSILNGLTIIAVICALTFVMVILVYFRLTKILFGYLLLSFFFLFFFISAEMFRVAIEAYELYWLDKITQWMLLANFAVVGTISIFFSQGIPHYVNQGYLLLASVLVAWQLSQFEPLTAWVLLILLAIYDLVAVLTPVGPLNCLMKVVKGGEIPPGLVFESRVMDRTSNSNRQSDHQAPRQETSGVTDTMQPVGEEESRDDRSDSALHSDTTSPPDNNPPNLPLQTNIDDDGKTRWSSPSSPADQQIQEQSIGESKEEEESDDLVDEPTSVEFRRESSTTRTTEDNEEPSQQSRRHLSRSDIANLPSACIPLALAQMYQLPLKDDPNPPWRQRGSRAVEDLSVEKRKELVEVVFPSSGGRIKVHPRQRPETETRYKVMDRNGNLRRILFVGETDGKVYKDESHEKACDQMESNPHERIRLGLGDFVFYSVLVSVASMQSFVGFVSCFIVILVGLCGTLFILALTKHALPALPISIFGAVVAFILSEVLIEDWIHSVHLEWTYV